MEQPKERNKVYRLELLSPGDRFYFAGDRKKIVYELNHEKPFENVRQKGFWIRYANCRNTTVAPGQIVVEAHKANRNVIYLRSN